MLIGKSLEYSILTEPEIRELAGRALALARLDGKKVLIIIPDATRTAPISLFFRIFADLLLGKVKKLDYLIALGTHPPMKAEAIDRLLGIPAAERESKFPGIGVFNHEWDNPAALTTIGTITAEEIEELSGGLMKETVSVSVNKLIFDYDQLIIVGPTFPHEVVGFSGGNKYFFPGIAGPDVLHFFHWLGAIITNPVINGTKDTPVRMVIDRAAAMITLPKLCFSLVVHHEQVVGLFIGTPEKAYSRAADLSARLHIIYVDRPFRRVLSIAPPMYDDLWTAGKCMYKLEPVVADGGELIIYAPHVTEVSVTHGRFLDRIGYHVRDYFLKQMDRFRDIPGGVMAHSTHVKGIGTFEKGVEKPRIRVTLATGIPEARCRKINLGYLDPQTIRIAEWGNREKEGILVVPKAGETLYRLKK